MQKSDKLRNEKRASVWGIMPLVIGMGLSVPLIAGFGFLILLKCGPWGVPLFLTYLALLLTPTAFWVSLRDRNNLQFIIGGELYYTQFPQSRKRALAASRRRGIPAQRQQILDDYRNQPLGETGDVDSLFEKKRRIHLVILMVMALLLLGMGLWLLGHGIALWRQQAVSFGKRPYLVPLFPLLAGFMICLTAMSILLKKFFRPLYVMTLLVMLFCAWGASISVSVNHPIILSDFLISFGCCAFYGLLIIGLLPRVQDVRTKAQIRAAEKELALDLFELEAIDESGLQKRLEQL